MPPNPYQLLARRLEAGSQEREWAELIVEGSTEASVVEVVDTEGVDAEAVRSVESISGLASVST